MCRTLIDDGFIDRGFRWRNNLLNRLRQELAPEIPANAGDSHHNQNCKRQFHVGITHRVHRILLIL
jgi:hypothetical protein